MTALVASSAFTIDKNRYTLLGILANLNNAVICMVSNLPLISSSTSLFTKLLGTIPHVPAIIGIIVTLIIHSFLSSLAYVLLPMKIGWLLGLMAHQTLWVIKCNILYIFACS